MTLTKTPESKALIRFQDCDPFNHLNNASYINYMINAREDQIKECYNLDIFDLAKSKGVSWVVGTNQIAYIRPALLMEKVTIDSQLIQFTENQLQVEIRMWNQDKTEIKAILWSTFVHFNLAKQKKWKHDQQLIELFQNVVVPISATSFEERISQFKPQKV
ncbi:acyl-CoA thioesterase [Aquimarina aquimarini]|uniref:acyl-CoA thioesterase n=1 Tax=Aquimarina aquimarini TaxID=1191734 RepID=UPI000D559E80|nr:acyl-CoA thioesterase [Aquimarina aquimarini]